MTFRKKVSRTARLLAPHWAKRIAARAFKKKKALPSVTPRRVSAAEIGECLRKLGLRRGDTLLAQTALSRIGSVDGGPPAYIRALESCVGPAGTLLIPTFNEPPRSYSQKFFYDVRNTPCNTGIVAEAFRKQDGVLRSLHPTHSVSAKGPIAGRWLAGHELSPTGFGSGTPYDHLAKEGGKILLVGNNNNSLVHYVELQAGFPLTHLPGSMQAGVVGYDGRRSEVEIRLHTLGERLVIVEDSTPEARDYVLLQDYLLIPGEDRRREIRALGFLRNSPGFLASRQEELERSGVLKFGRVGGADAAVIDAKPFTSRLAADLRRNLSANKGEYAAMASLSRNWNEIQWYCMVWRSRTALSAVKAARRALGGR
ncbi:MAG: AAC(3) family N-acetyltransferase [Candidatus Micrarchaeota archaeon]